MARFGRRLARLALWTAAGVVVAAALLCAGAWALFSRSLPRTAGEVALDGLSAPADVRRDALGIPVIRGADADDVARAEGFVHAQERFFQMDVARRFAAGELSDLMGSATLASDRRMRLRRFRAEAGEVLRLLPEGHRRRLEAYAGGVNAGLADLRARPPEYYLLGVRPAMWTAEDSLLCMFSMFEGLSLGGDNDERIAVMRAALPRELVDFLTPDFSRFDAPLLHNGDADYAPAPVPGPDIVDLRTRAPSDPGKGVAEPLALPMGSNNFAVAAGRSATGAAILANDMHLRLFAPNTWFREQLEWDGRRVVGVALPGVPGVVAGSNGRVAWGFTNTTGDFQDEILIDVDPKDPTRYDSGEGFVPFGTESETIRVRGGADVTLPVRTTRWGVVSGADHAGRPLVLKWTALDADKVNLALFDMADAHTVDEAIAVARRWNGPSQNVVVADDAGRIGWTVSGWLPQRTGFDGRTPTSWAKRGVGWDGELPDARRPTLVDPPDGVLYSANNRTADLDGARQYGDAWGLAVRANRIRELLRKKEKHDERSLLAIQLDTRAALYDLYRDLICECASDNDADETLARARRLAATWRGTADADERAFALLVQFRVALHERVITPLVAPCLEVDPTFRYRWFQAEEPVRRILEDRPAHLLPPGFARWKDVFRASLGDAVKSLASARPARPLDTPWGEANRAFIAHPLGLASRLLGTVLNMPRDPLPGHWSCVRVSARGFGASERMVVSPGREGSAILHMPTGESGHFLSEHYADQEPAWVNGEATPMLAGGAVSVLRLVPPG